MSEIDNIISSISKGGKGDKELSNSSNKWQSCHSNPENSSYKVCVQNHFSWLHLVFLKKNLLEINDYLIMLLNLIDDNKIG